MVTRVRDELIEPPNGLSKPASVNEATEGAIIVQAVFRERTRFRIGSIVRSPSRRLARESSERPFASPTRALFLSTTSSLQISCPERDVPLHLCDVSVVVAREQALTNQWLDADDSSDSD